jgi:hypothetical protein
MDLWDWLSNNPGKDKPDWPEWNDIFIQYGNIICNCFACHLCMQDCTSCPLYYLFYKNFVKDNDISGYDTWCERNINSLYYIWRKTLV